MTKPTPLLARWNWYWTFQLVGWSLLPLFMMTMAIGQQVSAAMVGICVWGGAGGVLLSDLWHRLLKRSGRLAPRWSTIGPAILVLGVLHTGLQVSGFLILRPFGPIKDMYWLPGALMFWWAAHLVWNIIYLTVLALRRANRFEQQALRLELQGKDAALRALQAQVNPHFFFNSMNSVRALIYEDRNAAARMVEQLADVMRYALESGRADTVPLGAELEAVRAYLAIEQIRFEQRMQVTLEVEAGLEQVRIPPMVLQTLVENAVKYGVEASAGGGEIRIRAQRRNGLIELEIANPGALLANPGSTGIGLANTRQRLALVLGPRAGLDLREQDGWVRATMTLPAAA